ncbi:MAG: acetyl-CoA carboxylase carboxyl transferase subunit alpha [Bacillota bacterium]|nr:MAG: acetyl-CoA carboxylase carboxyl transferase subunit alpha [Planctomycetota bacterium]RUA10209.1 MAG: acetyl-CoA carboxylase carboxyl transferase subunit alpha [Bacillota bacterium]
MENESSAHGLDFEAPIVELENRISELRSFSESSEIDLSGQLEELMKKCEEKKRAIYTHLSPWQRVQIARHPLRPLTSDYIRGFVSDFLELHGDGAFRDDPAIVTGLGRIRGRKVMIVGHRKGKTNPEKVACNFGMPHPEGYRKAMKKMRLAEKFNIPIISFINTAGAFPGIEAEERGQAFVIAKNLQGMASLRVPVVAIVIGEGGSGGAIGIGVADRILMLENSYYSVISPEGCAAILWKDASHAPRAAEILKLTSADLSGFGIVDEVITEPIGGAHREPTEMIQRVEETILRHLDEICDQDPDQRKELRFRKYMEIGRFADHQQQTLEDSG